MVRKNKNMLSSDTLRSAAQQGGTLLMAAAVTLGVLELTGHQNTKAIVPSQPALVFAGENDHNNPLRREKEEVAPHFISYNEVQRTASRSGTH